MELSIELGALNDLATVRYNTAIKDGHDGSVSRKQVVAVIILMKEGISKENYSDELRYTIYNLLVGPAVRDCVGRRLITSTKQIPGPIASVLIDQIAKPRKLDTEPLELTDYGKLLIERCEDAVKVRAA